MDTLRSVRDVPTLALLLDSEAIDFAAASEPHVPGRAVAGRMRRATGPVPTLTTAVLWRRCEVGDEVTGGRRYARRDVPVRLRLRAGLGGAFPPVWRRLDVASDLGLVDLHEVLQAVFGWEDRHLHRFTTGPDQDPRGVFVGTAELATALDDVDPAPTWDVRLDELLAEPGDRLHYRYDYGDDWHVVLEVEDATGDAVPVGRVDLLEGAGAAPPEDCGGIGGHRMLVAATDPDHPDHARARRDVAQLWGAEVTPERLGLVPFDPDEIAGRLAALDLPARPPVPRRVGPQLTQLLLRVRDTRTERQVLALASAADGPMEVDRDTAAAATRPLQLQLDAVGDGVKLTAAGYLPPAVVEQVFTELRLDEVWIGKGNREDLTLPVLELREATQQLGLLRKHTGRLLPTARWARLRDDPVALWCTSRSGCRCRAGVSTTPAGRQGCCCSRWSPRVTPSGSSSASAGCSPTSAGPSATGNRSTAARSSTWSVQTWRCWSDSARWRSAGPAGAGRVTPPRRASRWHVPCSRAATPADGLAGPPAHWHGASWTGTNCWSVGSFRAERPRWPANRDRGRLRPGHRQAAR